MIVSILAFLYLAPFTVVDLGGQTRCQHKGTAVRGNKATSLSAALTAALKAYLGQPKRRASGEENSGQVKIVGKRLNRRQQE
jgi:hypothetical protein